MLLFVNATSSGSKYLSWESFCKKVRLIFLCQPAVHQFFPRFPTALLRAGPRHSAQHAPAGSLCGSQSLKYLRNSLFSLLPKSREPRVHFGKIPNALMGRKLPRRSKFRVRPSQPCFHRPRRRTRSLRVHIRVGAVPRPAGRRTAFVGAQRRRQGLTGSTFLSAAPPSIRVAGFDSRSTQAGSCVARQAVRGFAART